MAKTWWGSYYLTAGATNHSKWFALIPNDTFEVKVIRTQLIFFNNPVFDSVRMDILDENLDEVLFSSQEQLKANIITLGNGVKDIYFEFENCVFRENEKYNISLYLTNYTGTAASHISWAKGITLAYPPSGYDKTQIGTMPYTLGIIGGYE